MKLKNFTSLLPRGAVILAFLLFSMNLQAQKISITTPHYCITADGGTVTVPVTKVRPASGDVTIKFWVSGDVDATTEYFDLYGEGSTFIGKSSQHGQCTGFDYLTYKVSAATFNSWAANGSVDFLADGSASVNMGNCTSDDNCVYLEISYQAVSGKDNAGVTDLVAPKNFCAGTEDIKVGISNNGSNQITSVKINWSLNGTLQTPVSYTSTLDTFGGSGSSTATVKLGSYTFSAGSSVALKVWTSSPNGKSDTVNIDDTLKTTLAPALKGTFTINPSGSGSTNYKTFKAAVSALTSQGICGPVVFNVSSATYKEQVIIPQITGASSTNTITFDGSAASTMPLITNAGTSTADMIAVTLDGADYVTLRGLKIQNTGATYGIGILLTNEANYNHIVKNTIISSLTATGAYHIGILASASTTSYTSYGNTANYNVIDSNTLTGGYYGIRLNGISTTSLVTGNKMLNNSIKDYYYYGIYLYYNGGHDIIGNTIESRTTGTTTTASYGIANYYAIDYTIQKNKIISNGYGMYLYYNNNYLSSTKQCVVANNMVITQNNYGIYTYYSYDLNIFHNTSLGNSSYGGYFYYSNNTDVRNNIFYSASTLGAIYISASNTFKNLDYNLYYAPSATGGRVVNLNGTYYGLSDWQDANPTFDQNSFNINPGFVSATDLHLTTSSGRPVGRYVGIDTDMDGDKRCKFAPTIGADESNVGKTSKPVAGFSGSDTLFVNSPVSLINTASPSAPNVYTWYVNGKVVTDSIHLKLSPAATGTLKIALVVEGCAGRDSISKDIIVVNPTLKPAVRFISDVNVIGQDDVVRFTDLSKNGASAWLWNISPDSIIIDGNKEATYKYLYGTNAASQNPVVQFLKGGRYRVCLTAKNAIGENTLCRTDYILVTGGINMGSQTVAIDSASYIYDNGGKNGDYTNNANDKLLIAPCAEEIYLVIKSFETECGYDFLRVYDGEDNTGTPLYSCPGVGFTGTSGSSCANYCRPALGDTLVAKSGKMYLEFTSEISGVYSGFEAYYWRKPKAQPEPVAGFTSVDSICQNQPVTFNNTTTGDDVAYYWDLDGDLSTIETTGPEAIWPYFVTGTYTVTLITQNCGGIDTFSKDIIVYSPNTPSVIFTADNTTPTTDDIVYFSSQIQECTDNYRWDFISSTGKRTYTFVNGTNAKSENPQVVFSELGCYTVSLFASNNTGEDSLKLSCFITVKEPYCKPSVGRNVLDLGISNVVFGTISNRSTQGVDDYQNFTPTDATILEIGVTYPLTVERKSMQNEISRTAWIDWNQDGDFDDSGEKVGEQTNSLTMSWTTDVKVPASAKTGASILRLAVNDGSLGNAPCGQNQFGEYEDYRVYIRPDLTAPVITLLGKDTVYVEQGYPYTDAGVTAEDNLDGDITALVVKDSSKFNNLAPRTYIFTYTVTDASGNVATPVKRVVIVTRDATPPMLEIAKPDTVYVPVFGTYTRPKVIRSEDLVDGGVTPVVADPVNVAVVDTYTVIYTATDINGNSISVNRTVIVRDTTAPVISLIGSDTVHHDVGTVYTDAGVIVSDNYYSSAILNDRLITVNNVNAEMPGIYTVTYTLADPSGNNAETVVRTVIVEDIIAPEVTLNGDTVITIEVYSTFNDPGVTATDNYDTRLDIVRSGSYYGTFPDGKATNLGSYTVIYTVTDDFGNSTVVSRTIKVADMQAPEISLLGDPNVNVCRWAIYTDAMYTVSDNFYKGSDITVTPEGSFLKDSTSLMGIYSLRYKAVDKDGNVGYSERRSINVTNPYEFPCTTLLGVGEQISLDKLVNIYPNPNQGKFTVEANLPATEQARITVTDLLGQEVAVISNGALGKNTFTVDLSNQKAGVYMLTVTTNKQSTTKRIVVTK